MAATAVLRSHQSHILDSHCNHNPKPNTRHHTQKRSPPGFNGRDETKSMIPDRTNPNLPKNMVIGQVKILKRGDPLPELNTKINNEPELMLKETPADKKLGSRRVHDDSDLALGSTGRLGPEPEIVQKQIKVSDFYAGSAPHVLSPHPSSLPLPAILTRKEKKIDDSISNLLRLLRLDCP